MARFGERLRRGLTTEEQSPPGPTGEVIEPTATERLAALLAEQNEIHATLAEHREQRAELLKQDDSLGAIRALGTEDAELKLRLEQLGARVPDLERELAEERRAQFEAAWQSHRPGLATAQADLTEAIQNFFAVMERANALHARAAQGFGSRVADEFVRPPPTVIYNDWALREYLKAIERRQRPAAAAQLMVEMAFDAPFFVPAAERFVPKRVPYQLVEEISPIAPMRRVRLLHTVRASNLNIGHARLRAGEEMEFPARAAFALTYSGVGVYTDIETAETATAAA